MSVQSACKSAAIITLGVVLVCAVATAGAFLIAFGATIGLIFIGVLIAVAVVVTLIEEISNWWKTKFSKKKPGPASR